MMNGLGARGKGSNVVPVEDELICGSCEGNNMTVGKQCICCPVDVQDEEEIQVHIEDEESEEIANLANPRQPSQSEYADHCVTHYPYRSWCKHCVEGRGREFGHVTHPKGVNAIPTISFDYAFVGDGDDISDQDAFEAAGEGAVKLLVVRDSRSKAVFGHVVPTRY